MSPKIKKVCKNCTELAALRTRYNTDEYVCGLDDKIVNPDTGTCRFWKGPEKVKVNIESAIKDLEQAISDEMAHHDALVGQFQRLKKAIMAPPRDKSGRFIKR